MGLSAFNRARARQKAEEEALKAEQAEKAEELEVASPEPVVESVPEPVKVKEQTSPIVEKPKNKRTDAEKLKGKKE